MMPQAVLVYRSVHKSFGALHALKGIDLLVPEGEVFGLVGPDGAGKSTMIRLAMGIVRADSGSVTLLGSDSPQSAKTHVGYVPQTFSLYTDMTVMENVRLYGELYGCKPDETDAIAKEMLSRTGLWRFRNRFAGNLSGGMKQKLSLAVGLLHRPKALFLDEPTTGVDPIARREFWAMLYEFNALGVTIVVSTPYMDEAELCTKLAFVNGGEILVQGTPDELVASYRHELLDVDTSDPAVERLLVCLPGILDVNLFGTHYHIEVENAEEATRAIRERFRASPLSSVSISKIDPSIEDLFVLLASDKRTAHPEEAVK